MNDWFSWNGVKCTEYGIHVLEQPPPTIPLEQMSCTSVPGRPGSLTILEGEAVYDDMVLAVQCLLADPAQIPAIAALTGTYSAKCSACVFLLYPNSCGPTTPFTSG